MSCLGHCISQSLWLFGFDQISLKIFILSYLNQSEIGQHLILCSRSINYEIKNLNCFCFFYIYASDQYFDVTNDLGIFFNSYIYILSSLDK